MPVPLPAPPAKSGRGFIWPLKGELIAEYGSTGKGQHNDGINIAAPRGTAVVAAESGVVAYAGNELRGFGNLLLIKHDEGWMTAYAHNDQLLVHRGDVVRRGQKIALVGDSGGVGQPQLHFELRQGTRAIDPMPVLAGKSLPSTDPTDPG
jgi:murein DD-endopeptidase MepM/ murein hydrolase activator NlpD